MRKVAVFVAALLALVSARRDEIGPMVGAGVGFGFVSGEGHSEAGFRMGFDGVVPIYGGLCARAGLLSLWAGDNTTFTFGTGTDVDLMYIASLSSGVEPYGFGGLGLTATSGFTTFAFRFGGGMNYKLPSAPIKLAGELGFELSSFSTDYSSSTTFGFNFMFGIRFGR